MDTKEMERIAGPHGSKAAKIRALNEAGVSTSDISTFLEIRYQHTYNVLLRAGRIRRDSSNAEQAPVLAMDVRPDGTTTLPASVLADFDLLKGGQLFARQTPEGLLLMPRQVAIAEMQRVAAERMPEHASLLQSLLQG
ncbi:hypothetical protein [Sphingomonas sp. CFBP 13720]|uniref:hypothetical protein n=1 Tax=Sphingomonas sp. CFBP 13720 TaxID=2775302 RepID=UPI0017840455|nr:hypothetical protein [Sphingomonas sp. CFBP 13720]MBD8680058.1 hypothetical protein [Sphingomonas sp. CFBP 13720]